MPNASECTPSTVPEILAVGCLTLDRVTIRASCQGKELELTIKEFNLLAYFMQNAGRPLTRQQLLAEVWNNATIDERSVDAEIGRLRRAMGRKRSACTISTIRKIGYVLGTPAKSPNFANANSVACRES